MQFHRRSIRLPEYDYSDFGYYFVTICTQDRELYFDNNKVKQMVENIWFKLTTKFNNIDLDEYIVMPNHLHGIIIIHDNEIVGAGLVPALLFWATTSWATTRVAPTELLITIIPCR